MATGLRNTVATHFEDTSGSPATVTISSYVVAAGATGLVVRIGWMNDLLEVVNNVKWDGDTLVDEGSSNNSDDSRVELFTFANPAVKTGDIVVEFSAAIVATDINVAVSEITEGDTVDVGGTFVGATGDTATITVDVSSATNELVVDVAGIEDQTLSVGPDQSEDFNLASTIATPNKAGDFAGSQEPGGTTITMSWTVTSDHWSTCGISLKFVATAAEIIPDLIMAPRIA